MKNIVFIPTYRPGGLDIIEASIKRQSTKDFTVYVADALFDQRWKEWTAMGQRLGLPLMVSPGPEVKPGYKRALAAAYNDAAQFALRVGADLLISLQDYIWIPEDGVWRFIELNKRCPDDLLTGLTSIAAPPVPRVDKISHYTIFEEPYYDKPDVIDWYDVRHGGIYEKNDDLIIIQVLPEHWEANWAAIPVNFFRAGIFWDEEFDKGIAYENCDFARRAIERTGRRVILDTQNHAISLPHKKYFPGEEEEILEFSNREKYEERWGE